MTKRRKHSRSSKKVSSSPEWSFRKWEPTMMLLAFLLLVTMVLLGLLALPIIFPPIDAALKKSSLDVSDLSSLKFQTDLHSCKETENQRKQLIEVLSWEPRAHLPQFLENGEGLQVLHHEAGQKYEPHFDYFLDEFNAKNEGQRIATVLMYLSDVEEGGETMFPSVKVNESSVPYWNELSECGKTGLAIRPKMGDALLFWSMRPDATLDPMSLHVGCPVIKGNKWSSTKWIHVNEFKA